VPQVKNGDTVRVHYTGSLSDGQIFDSSVDREPLEFTVGEHRVVPGFEQAVLGMSVGESKTAHLPADQAYGQRDDRLVIQVSKDQLPPNMAVKLNDRLQMQSRDGRVMNVTVAEISDDSLVLDGNHFLAGKDLIFDIELVEIA
jgi:FKBP-type peptidyl-prolyl cis-trans isomerase 2